MKNDQNVLVYGPEAKLDFVPAFLHGMDGTPHCYICGLCGALEELSDGRFRHASSLECIRTAKAEIVDAWDRASLKET